MPPDLRQASDSASSAMVISTARIAPAASAPMSRGAQSLLATYLETDSVLG